MAGGAAVERAQEDGRRRRAVFQAADDIRAEGVEAVSLRTVWARVKRDHGVAGNNQTIGRYYAEWTADRCYDPVIEMSGMPKSVATGLAKAGVDLWAAAQAEAARIYQRDRQRLEAEVAAERKLREEALAMLDAREAVIDAQRNELAWYATEVDRMRQHLVRVRARAFWRTVAEEIWRILPERDPMHLADIVPLIGNEFVKEAEDYPGEWGVDLIRGVMDQRIKFHKLFAKEGTSQYRRRRPEDDARPDDVGQEMPSGL